MNELSLLLPMSPNFLPHRLGCLSSISSNQFKQNLLQEPSRFHALSTPLLMSPPEALPWQHHLPSQHLHWLPTAPQARLHFSLMHPGSLSPDLRRDPGSFQRQHTLLLRSTWFTPLSAHLGPSLLPQGACPVAEALLKCHLSPDAFLEHLSLRRAPLGFCRCCGQAPQSRGSSPQLCLLELLAQGPPQWMVAERMKE